MFSNIRSFFLLTAILLASFAQATQVNLDAVGPLTPLSAKSKICNVLDYGGVADNKTDIGPAIKSAFSSCAVKGGATLYIPPGSYSLATGVVLNKGKAFAFQIDGLITLTSGGSFNGNAFVIQNAVDVEVFSSNGLGAINGQGYITRITKSGQNARLFRFIASTNIAIHDIILVDSPTFHLVFVGASNLEAYHITIRGPSVGGTDGIDLACTNNCYLHDIEVTNRDECIAVKSPSQNVLIEDIFCNQSGGMSIGSLSAASMQSPPFLISVHMLNSELATTPAAVSNITMRNINVYQCTQMLMIKTFPGGTGAVGYVKDSVFENFHAYDTTYGLDIDQYWQSTTTPNTGAVALSGLTFSNWTGTVDNGISRAPIVIRGSSIVPLVDITLEDFNMWTVNGGKLLNQCKNVYGTGYCAAKSTAGVALTTFTTTVTTISPPAGYTAPTKPAWGIQGYGTNLPIPVYTPAVLWSVASAGTVVPGKAAVVVIPSSPASTAKFSIPTKASSSAVVAISSSVVVEPSSTLITATKPASTSIPITSIQAVVTPAAALRALSRWSQCGGQGWAGSGACIAGTTCKAANKWYSQCL